MIRIAIMCLLFVSGTHAAQASPLLLQAATDICEVTLFSALCVPVD